MADTGERAEKLRAALVAAGLDPVGLDLEFLAYLKDETEERIAAHRQDSGFASAVPAFNPPKTAAARG